MTLVQRANCGTDAGHGSHIYYGEPPCDACRDAHNEARRRRYNNPDKTRRGPTRCGTYAGYQRHRTIGEPPCDACREARNAYQRAWHRSKGHRTATMAESVLDVLETYWPDGLSTVVLVDRVLESHPDWNGKSVRRTLYRLTGEGLVERAPRPDLDEMRWRFVLPNVHRDAQDVRV